MLRFSWLFSIRLLLGLFLLLALSLSQPDSSYAHAVLVNSSLDGKPVQPQTAVIITFYFDSNIEISLSRVFLIGKDKSPQQLEIKVGTKPGEMLINLPPLAEGKYTLRYKVFSADGHLTEDSFYFRVSLTQ